LGAYYLLTAGYIENEKPEEAVQQLEANLAKNPSDFQARFLIASLFKEMGDLERAIEAFKKVIEIEPGFAAAYNNLAYLYLANPGQLEQAYEAAKQARQLEPANPAIADTIGWIAFQREDYAGAMGLVQEAAKALPDNAEVQFHLGMAAYMMGEPDQAREALEKALAGAGELDDDDTQSARKRLATIGIVRDGAKSPSTDDLEGIIAEDAGDIIALVELGRAYERANRGNEAVTTYEKALEINPDLVAVLANLAQLHAGPLKDPAKALSFAKRAREMAPNDPKIAGVLGEVAFQARNFEWACSLLEESLRQDRDNAATLLALGRATYSLGRVEDARTKMERVLVVSPDSPWADDARAFLSLTRTVEKRDLVAAMAEADEALIANPGDVPALMIKAAAQINEGNEDGARETLLIVLDEYPDFAPAQRDLAILYSGDSSAREKAYELATVARHNLPDDAILARTLGVLSFHRADYSYAVQLLEECGKSEALDAEALYYLGMARIQLNRRDKGYEALRGALKQGLSDPLATEARQAIEGAEPVEVE
jgi:tetratricopeptide (TPR) repeat protein